MENINENPATEPEVFETPVIVEEPIVEQWHPPVFEEPVHVEPAVEEVPVEAPAEVIHAPAYPTEPEV